MGKGTLYHFIAQALFVLSGYVIHIGLARYLGPEEYGVFSVVFSIFFLSYRVLNSGASPAISKYTAEGESEPGAVLRAPLRMLIVLALVVSALYVLGAGMVSDLLKDRSLAPYIRISGIAFPPMAIYAAHVASLNGRRAFGKAACTISLYSISKVIVILGLTFLGCRIGGIIVGYAISATIGAFIAVAFCGFPRSRAAFPIRRLISFSVPLLISSVLGLLSANIGLWLVKRMLADNVQVGFYTAACNLVRTPAFLASPFMITLLPSISKSSSAGDVDLSGRYMRQSLRYMLMFFAPIALLISGTAGNLVELLYTSKFLEAGGPLCILSFALLFGGIRQVASTVLIGTGHPKTVAWITACMLPISAALSVLFIPLWGVKGAALARSATAFIGLVLSGSVVYWKFGIWIEARSVLRILGAAGIIYVLAMQFPVSGMVLLPQYAALLMIYGMLLVVSREINGEDVQVVKDILKLA